MDNVLSVRQPAAVIASPARALVLATISFTLSFAAWGLIGGLAPTFTALNSLTASETALLVAVAETTRSCGQRRSPVPPASP